MSQQVQELIDKIKIEGVDTAKKEAEGIKEQAEKQAKEIIEQAQAQARQITAAAESESKKLKESTTRILVQSSRDTLLALRLEIEKVLKSIVSLETQKSLSTSELAEILKSVIEKTVEKKKVASADITVSARDLKSLEANFLAKLQKELKSGIKLQASDEVAGGFTISYDGGKSSFEFTDESLTNYLSSFLNSQVSTILKESLNS